jgi:hypothetical protein
MRQFQVLQGGSFSSMVLLSSRNRISVVTLELLKHCTDFWGNNRGAFLFSCAGLVFQRFSYFPRTARFIFETSAVSRSQCFCTYFSVATMYRPCRLERGLAATTTQLSPPPPLPTTYRDGSVPVAKSQEHGIREEARTRMNANPVVIRRRAIVTMGNTKATRW